ncbi:MAG: alcohol dehydrogenase catalytic domain-containing protein, partial [Candidatus Eremiobacteraeota bacterium]|nr:alcohol dehydrogenase catalytic domain-containing protein [Candidatus Eremiobacteraeota bacterium]
MPEIETAGKTMKAFVFMGEGKYELQEVPVPRVKNDDEVLLKIEAAGICGTDCHICSVPPGHPAS